MATLKTNMTHADAVGHLRKEVIGTFHLETGRLIEDPPPAFFGAARGMMCDLDYVAALYAGWPERPNRRQIATTAKSVAFLKGVFSVATGDVGYQKFGEHVYEMYRVGTVHLRAPKQLTNPSASTAVLSWGLFEEREERFDYPFGSGKWFQGKHLQPVPVDAQKTILPVSIKALFEDFTATCEYFARQLEAEKVAGGTALIDRWRLVADALCDPEPTTLMW